MWKATKDSHCMTHGVESSKCEARSRGITGSWEFSSEEGEAATPSGEGALEAISSLLLELFKVVLEHCLPGSVASGNI